MERKVKFETMIKERGEDVQTNADASALELPPSLLEIIKKPSVVDNIKKIVALSDFDRAVEDSRVMGDTIMETNSKLILDLFSSFSEASDEAFKAALDEAFPDRKRKREEKEGGRPPVAPGFRQEGRGVQNIVGNTPQELEDMERRDMELMRRGEDI